MTTVTGTVATSAPAAVRANVLSQVVYYIGCVGMILTETALWSVFGVFVGLVVFSLGGIAWSWWQFGQTAPGERLHGPVLWLTQRLLGGGVLGFVAAVLIGGPPGVAAVAASSNYRDGRRLIVESSLLYAMVWAAFHVARPSAGLPIHFGPSLPGWL
jgi:hypothetical protein